MYIIKNALRCVSRAKGRNVLIGIIALIIAVSACLGLSIIVGVDEDDFEAAVKAIYDAFVRT